MLVCFLGPLACEPVRLRASQAKWSFLSMPLLLHVLGECLCFSAVVPPCLLTSLPLCLLKLCIRAFLHLYMCLFVCPSHASAPARLRACICSLPLCLSASLSLCIVPPYFSTSLRLCMLGSGSMPLHATLSVCLSASRHVCMCVSGPPCHLAFVRLRIFTIVHMCLLDSLPLLLSACARPCHSASLHVCLSASQPVSLSDSLAVCLSARLSLFSDSLTRLLCCSACRLTLCLSSVLSLLCSCAR